eukprot:363203-Chlamydomonas_euryale.AAC.26
MSKNVQTYERQVGMPATREALHDRTTRLSRLTLSFEYHTYLCFLSIARRKRMSHDASHESYIKRSLFEFRASYPISKPKMSAANHYNGAGTHRFSLEFVSFMLRMRTLSRGSMCRAHPQL